MDGPPYFATAVNYGCKMLMKFITGANIIKTFLLYN